MKNGFIELTNDQGNNVYVNTSNILWFEKDDDLTMISVSIPRGNGSNFPFTLFVKNSYEDVKHMIMD